MSQMVTQPPRRDTYWSQHIAGGVRKIQVRSLAIAWWLYRVGELTPRQFRAYFALHEMHERRRASGKARTPAYGFSELRRLLGTSTASDEALRADCDRLRELGIADYQHRSLAFPGSEPVGLATSDQFAAFVAELPHPRRSIPVPRRMVRALAAGMQRAVAGTMIALLVRGLFWQRDAGRHRLDGRVKAGWIARVFGLSIRVVKQARQRLQDLGWIELLPVTQWESNRWGVRYVINAEWKPSAESAPRSEAIGTDSAPPESDSSPLPEIKLRNRTPAVPLGQAVACQQKREGEGLHAVSISDLKAGDLSDFGRLLTLYEQAKAVGLAGGGDAGRLDFFALACRAMRRGREPLKLFSWLLHRKRFDVISDADEDEASRWLKRELWGRSSAYSARGHGLATLFSPPDLCAESVRETSTEHALDDEIPW